MGKADRVSSVFWLLFSIFAGIESYRLGLGTGTKPGPGFLFFWISLALGLLSLVILIRTWSKTKPGAHETIFGKQNTRKIVLVLTSAFLYAAFMERVGFILVTLMLFLFLLGIIEKKRWSFTVLVALMVTTFSYLVFEIWLRSQLPKGILSFLRF